MAEIDLGQVKMTDAELMNFILQFNGGVRFGKDAEGNAGYITTDEETGADTVIPFNIGGGGGSFEGGDILFFSFNSSSSSSTYQSTYSHSKSEKDYKKVLFLAMYYSTNSSYNKLTTLEILKNSNATYTPEEEWSCDNLFNKYGPYMKASLRGEVKSGETIGFMTQATISSPSSALKYIMCAGIGLY